MPAPSMANASSSLGARALTTKSVHPVTSAANAKMCGVMEDPSLVIKRRLSWLDCVIGFAKTIRWILTARGRNVCLTVN